MAVLEADVTEEIYRASPTRDWANQMVIARKVASKKLMQQAFDTLKTSKLISLQDAQKIGLVDFYALTAARDCGRGQGAAAISPTSRAYFEAIHKARLAQFQTQIPVVEEYAWP